jgi:murein DD-endopeptidase MepM/ murein hydrolase activator NlpD
MISPMRFLVRAFFFLVLLAALGAGGAYLYAGRLPKPQIQINKPDKYVGIATPLDVVVTAPGATLSKLTIILDQGGTQTPLYTQGDTTVPAPKVEGDRILINRVIGKETVPTIKSGPAKIIITAARKVARNIRTVESTVTRDVEVRLERPRVSVVSTHHYINLGGTEMIVYRVTPNDVESGVLVGDLEYPGFPAAGAKVEGASLTDPSLRVAFYALLWNQDLHTPMRLFARDAAGNTARADFDFTAFPKPFKKSRIELKEKFLERAVPAILETTSEVKPEGDTLAKFLVINGELRRKNAAKIASMVKETSPEMLWGGVVFHPFTNNAVEAAFADQRTYVYQGKEVDKQTHLGFDLASYAGTPVVAANRGKVLYAEELGIYGNCVILDHGMGVQSLYAHLSSIDVKPGDMVNKEQTLGRSGMTGLAEGDHLHFTMLVNGHMVNPVEWWDSHWIQDRILRKLRTPGA